MRDDSMNPETYNDDMREEYEIRGGVRGKYYERYRQGPNFVVLDSDASPTEIRRVSTQAEHLPNRRIWVTATQRIVADLFPLIDRALDDRRSGREPLATIPRLALFHLLGCLQTSMSANERGEHSVAMSLLRQCVETLFVVELGFQDATLRDPVIAKWVESRKPQSEMRQYLDEIMPRRQDAGLWNESWYEFVSNLTRAVQPYAHYTSALAGWQIAQYPHTFDNRVFALVGPAAFDIVNATRISLLHALVVWALGEITQRAAPDVFDSRPDVLETIQELKANLRTTELLQDHHNWADQIASNVLAKPQRS